MRLLLANLRNTNLIKIRDYMRDDYGFSKNRKIKKTNIYAP